MSTRLGTVPGWERAADWTSDNRVYEGVGPTIDIFPEYAGEELAYYWIKFDVLFYFCESPPISPVVFRTLKDCMVVQIFVSPLEEPIPIFDDWINKISETIISELVEDIHRMSIIEMGGLRKCGISKEENYVITFTDKGSTIEEEKISEEEKKMAEKKVEERPKVPDYILGQIEYLEDRYKEAESTDEKIAIREEINRLKERYKIV